MITVVFHLDLTHVVSGERCSGDQSRAIQELQKSIEGAGLTGSAIQYRSVALLVLVLPNDEKALGDLIYWCGYGKFPYKTLWLNAVAEWREAGSHD